MIPPILQQAGFTTDIIREIDRLMVGCGGFVRELISFTSGASTVKDDSGQRVCAADEAVDQLLRERLMPLFPTSSGYSEEGGEFGFPSHALRVRWLIDPVDGTRPATLGGAFAVCLGGLVLEDDAPLAALGWVYVPTLSALYRGIIAEGFVECSLNDRPAYPENVAQDDVRNRYIAVGSDWHSAPLRHCPMKLSAPGATAVHLTQLVQPGSDVAAVLLSRYRPYDAAAGLVVAAAGGCAIYPVDGESVPRAKPVEPLAFLQRLNRKPAEIAPRTLVCPPAVHHCFRGD